MAPMLLECGRCGAPLDVSPDARVVKCKYCDRSDRVASSKTLAALSPADFFPPKTWTPVEAPGPSAMALPPRSYRQPAMVVAGAVIFLIGGNLAWSIGVP